METITPEEKGLKVELSPQGQLHCLVKGEISPHASEVVREAIQSSDYRANLSVRLELELRRQVEVTRIVLYGIIGVLGMTVSSWIYFGAGTPPLTPTQGEMNVR